MIALTAAIMDCFHQGHKNILEVMRANSEWVIVVIHDDLACYQIKDKIPVQTVEHRRRNILLTGLADEVLITRSVDPADVFAEVMKKHRNLVFMRGDDNLDFPGKWILDQNDIPIKYIAYTSGVSSTEIREKKALE